MGPERLDAKYYTYLESKLYKITHRNCNDIIWQPLGQIVEIKKAIRPNINENREIEYINISNVDADLSIITSNEKDLYKNLSSRIRYVLKENELITAKSGSATGSENHTTAIVTGRYEGMMASDAFYNIRTIEVDPYYLLFLFKQPIILKQIEAGSTGQYFKTINRNEFEEISIPRLNPLIETEVAKKMKIYIRLLQK
ncbi:MAG: restriction endonuclease subunit S [Staphylococcus equorum]|nr:restriction endonuclease subunit S [Staphylococcus equorum]